MKFFKLFVLIWIISVLLCSCEGKTDISEKQEAEGRFVMIERDLNGPHNDIYVYVDTVTGVQYSLTPSGSLMPLYDQDGKLLIYEEKE